MDRPWSLLVLLLIFLNSVNCLIPEAEALKDIVEALSRGEIDFDDVNIALEDLGVEVNETDADDLLLDYTHHFPHLDLQAVQRSKRSLADDSHIPTPIDLMDLHLGGIENIDSTTITEDVIFSNSFNLEVGSVKQTMIYVDNLLYAIRNGALVQLTCPKCTLDVPGTGWKVTKTVVVSTSPNFAYVVQATARNNVEGTETYSRAIFVACKVNLVDAETIEATHNVELLADMTRTPFSIAESYPRVSMVETFYDEDDGFLVASFHKRLGKVAGPHLTYVNSNLMETHITNSFLTNTEITDGIVDIELVKVHQKEEYKMIVANDRAVFIFAIGKSAAGFDFSLVQKWHISDVVDIVWNSDSIGTFLTILQSNGNMETRLLGTDGFFVKMQDFSYDIGFDSWRSVETSQDKDLPSQDLVVFKDTVKGIKFVRHVMPGMYEELEAPFGLTDYVTANPNYETIDLARSVISEGEYEYFWLVKPIETRVDYIKININPIPFTINQLNDVTICLQDMEYTLLLDQQIGEDKIHDFDTLIRLDSLITNLDLDVSYITVSGSADIDDLTINMESSSSITYDEIDYTNTASSLSEGHLLVNQEDQSDSHIFANTLFKDGPHISTARVESIKSNSVELNNGVFNTLSTTNLKGKKVDDIIKNLLTLNEEQNIASKMDFNKIEVSGETQIGTAAVADTSDGEAALVIPEDFVDLSKTNTLAFNLNLNEVVFDAANSQTFESTVNAIDVSSILTTSEMQASTLETPIIINGVKTFTNDITADLTEVNSIGSKTKQDLLNFVDRVLYTNESRVLSLNSLQFGDIIVTVGATINQLNNLDVSTSVLNNLVMDIDNTPITINDNTVFQNKIEIDDLTTTYLNSVAPGNYLYEGNDQTIEATMNLATLAIPHLQNSAEVNNWDLTTAARIDSNQVLDTKVVFATDIIVDNAISSATGITIGGTDFSEVGRILHVYDDVAISSSVGLKQNDVAVDVVSINGNSVNFNLANLQDSYLMTDIEQTLPSLTDIQQDVSINNFEVGATLDGIQLSNVLTVSGEQTASTTNLAFTGTSKFYTDMIIQGGDLAAINDVKIKDLRDDILCDKSDDGSDTVESTGTLTITDSDTIVVKSFFDLEVLENLKVFDGNAYKSYGAFNNEVVDLKKTNTFNQKIKFADVTISDVLNSNVDIVGNNAATINNKNLAQFEETIVKKSESTHVITPVDVKNLAGVGKINTGSTFDGNSLDDHYNQYIVLDKNLEQTITAKLSSDNDMIFDNLNVVPQANDDTYFNNKNLVDYESTLLKSTNVVGSKHLKGIINIGGNLNVNSDSNSNYLFSINLKNIADTAVYISKDQAITAHVTANDITAKTVFTHEVNGIELNSMCFKDESCVLKENSDVKFSGASLSFPTEMAVDGMLNGDTFVNRELHLTERSIDLITNLESASKLVFTIIPESTSSLTHLLSDAVRQSSSQVITSATFNNVVKVTNNFDITSKTINLNEANEVNFAAIVEDAAFLNQVNVFTADSIEVGDISVSGGSLSVSELKNTLNINDVDLSNYLDIILVKSTDSSLVQTVVGDVDLSSGLAITGTAYIASRLDGIQVGDYVLKDFGNDAKTIFGITFDNTVSVDGAVSSTSATFKDDLDNFFNSVVYANKQGTQSLSKNFNFDEDVNFNTLQVVTVNGITADDFVLLNAASPQTIRQSFSQAESTIAANLFTTTINDIDLESVEPQILMKDREETITTPAKVTFNEDVILPNNEITIQEFPTIIQDFITVVENFSSSLMTYYMDYIATPLSATIEEIYVANRVGYKRVKYLDQIMYDPSWFSNHFDSSNYILGIDAIQQGQDKYFVKLEGGIIGDDCSLAEGCVCKNTSISYQSSDSSFQQDFAERAFTFTLDSMSLTATSSYDATESCPTSDSGELHVKAVELNKVDLQVHMPGTTAESLGNVYDSKIISGVYSVLDMELIQFGAGHLLAITTGYANGADNRLIVYSMTGGVITQSMSITSSVPIKSLKTLNFRKEKDNKDLEVVHILASVENTGVTVYEWIYDAQATIVIKEGELLQTIPTTFFSAMDVFKSKPGPKAQENVYITVAYESVFNFITYSVMDMLEYNMVNELYVYSPVVQKHKCRRDTPVTKIQAKQISDYVSIALSVNGVIELYDFIANVGLQKVSDYFVNGNLVDWTWFTERLPKTKSTEDLTTLLFIVKEMGGVQSTETLRVGTSGKLTLPNLNFQPDALGF